MKIRERIAAVILSAAIVTGLTAPMPFTDGILTVSASAAATVKQPKASLAEGTYVTSSSKTVKLTCATKGAEIYYSQNGGSYKKYTKALTISKNTTLKFYSKKGSVKSKVVTVKYKLSPEINVSIDEGRYYDSQTVKLTSGAKNVTFYYTLDGTKPMKSSTKYTSAGIKVKKNTTLRVLAVKKNWTNNYESYEYQITSGSSILDNYSEKYFYKHLTADKQLLYKELYNCFADHLTHMDTTNEYTGDDFYDVFRLVLHENPQFFYVNESYTYYYYERSGIVWVSGIDPDYRWDAETAQKMRSEMDTEAKWLLKEIPDGADEFTTALTLHDLLVENVTYTKSDTIYNVYCAYGALVDGEAVCGGYSSAFAFLCQLAGIQCMDIQGYTSNESTYPDHEWNRVVLGGEMYNVDITWDDTDIDDEIKHEWFCVTDEYFEYSHARDDFYPYSCYETADATEMNYFERLNVKFYTDPDEAYEDLVEGAVDSFQDGVYVTGIYCSDWVKSQLFDRLYDNFEKDVKRVGYTKVPKYYWGTYKNDYLSFKVQ